MNDTQSLDKLAPTGPKHLIPHLWAYFRQPLASYQDLRRRYGEPFSVPFPLGGRMVVTGCPKQIEQIFSAPGDSYQVVDDSATVFYGKHSLVALDGAAHARLRRAFNAKMLRRQGHTATQAVMREVALRTLATQAVGEPFEMIKLARAITLDVILRTVFGVLDDAELEDYRQAISALQGTIGFWTVFVKPARRDFGAWSPWAKFISARQRCYELIERSMARLKDQAENETTGASVLAQLLARQDLDGAAALSAEEIRDNLLTLLFAGYDSTAIALTWAFYWVHREPGVRLRLLQELDAFGFARDAPVAAKQLQSMRYLNAVCREALRVHPVALGVARRLRSAMELGQRRVPAGDVVMACIDLVSHDPALYADPSQFRPERFLERDYKRNEFIPFGGGQRYCPGAVLALDEMRMVLATLVSRYRFRLLESREVRPTWSHAIRTPASGVRMLLEGPR